MAKGDAGIAGMVTNGGVSGMDVKHILFSGTRQTRNRSSPSADGDLDLLAGVWSRSRRRGRGPFVRRRSIVLFSRVEGFEEVKALACLGFQDEIAMDGRFAVGIDQDFHGRSSFLWMMKRVL